MLVDHHGKMKAQFFVFISFVHLFYGMTNGMISLFNEIFYISEYKAMFIQLLIYHIYIYIYIYIYR